MKRIPSVALGRHLFVIAGLALASTVRSLSAAVTDTYYVSDHLATTTAVADAAGEIASIEADAFGSPVSEGEQSARYTGKPYDADIGAYVFPFRNYRSDEARWMSADPSGFPDGVNGRFYAPAPNRTLDPLGLNVQLADMHTVEAAIQGFEHLGWSAAVRRANHSRNNGGNEVASAVERVALFTAAAFTSVINTSYFEQAFINQGRVAGAYSQNYAAINYGVDNNGVPTNDLAAAYGRLGGNAAGAFTAQNNSDGSIYWSITVAFSFSDVYDFGGSDPFSAAFRRLQESNVYSIYTTTGTYSKTFHGRLE